MIDAGLFRGIFYDDKLKMPGLRAGWCSQASVRQRAGRTGRVAPGRVVCLYTRRFHDECMPAHDEAELMRVPLEQTVLRVKLLLSQLGWVRCGCGCGRSRRGAACVPSGMRCAAVATVVDGVRRCSGPAACGCNGVVCACRVATALSAVAAVPPRCRSVSVLLAEAITAPPPERVVSAISTLCA